MRLAEQIQTAEQEEDNDGENQTKGNRKQVNDMEQEATWRTRSSGIPPDGGTTAQAFGTLAQKHLRYCRRIKDQKKTRGKTRMV